MIIAVTGATGYVGRFIVAELQRRGIAVRAWARSTSDRSGFAGEVGWVEGSLSDHASMDPLLNGVDAVVHAAFEHSPGCYRGGEGRDLSRFLSTNVGGSIELLRRARHHGIRRFVFLSSRAVFGRRLDAPLDETHPLWPDSHYGAYKAAVEAFISSFGSDAAFTAAALRPTGVYGLTHPRRRSKWFEIVRAVLAEEPVTIIRGGTEVHGRDVAQAVWSLLTSNQVGGECYNCSDLYVTSRRVAEIVQEISGARGPLPEPPSTAPKNVMETGKLRSLGLVFGGERLLEETIRDLIAAVRACGNG